MAFALGADVVTLFAIFTALALGMALPWIMVAIFPSIALKLPKPGQWMNVVKDVFGVMMLATSVLATVFDGQSLTSVLGHSRRFSRVYCSDDSR